MSDNHATTRDISRVSANCSGKAIRDSVRIGTKWLRCSTLALDGHRITEVDRSLTAPDSRPQASSRQGRAAGSLRASGVP